MRGLGQTNGACHGLTMNVSSATTLGGMRVLVCGTSKDQVPGTRA